MRANTQNRNKYFININKHNFSKNQTCNFYCQRIIITTAYELFAIYFKMFHYRLAHSLLLEWDFSAAHVITMLSLVKEHCVVSLPLVVLASFWGGLQWYCRVILVTMSHTCSKMCVI